MVPAVPLAHDRRRLLSDPPSPRFVCQPAMRFFVQVLRSEDAIVDAWFKRSQHPPRLVVMGRFMGKNEAPHRHALKRSAVQSESVRVVCQVDPAAPVYIKQPFLGIDDALRVWNECRVRIPPRSI